MKLKANLILLVLSLSPPAVWAGSDSVDMADMMAPGLWEMNVQMQMEGVPMSMPAQTLRKCITQVTLDKSHGLLKPQTHGNITCNPTSMDRSGNTIHWTMACSGQGEMQMDGTVAFDSRDAYHSTVHMNGSMQGHPIRMIQTTQGKRIGECGN